MKREHPVFANRPHPPAPSPNCGRRGAKSDRGEVPLPDLGEGFRERVNQHFYKSGMLPYEASSVFMDPLSVTFPDPEHSNREERYVIIGLSNACRILVVPHTDRRDRIRIISARQATRNEQRFYEDGE